MSQCFCKCTGAHDRWPGLILLIILATVGAIGSALMTCEYRIVNKKPGIYHPKPKRTTIPSGPTSVTGVRG